MRARSMLNLRCEDSEVGARLQRWLESGRLTPPASLTLDVAVAEEVGELAPDGQLFEQPGVEIRSGGLDGRVSIAWRPAPAVAVLTRGTSTASVVLSRAAAARLEECQSTFLTTVLIFLLRRAGWHHVHAATAVDPRGRGWLIAGNARAGKSTTTAWLASRGWGVGTDDLAFLAPGPERVAVHACRAPIALREGGRALLGCTGGVFLERRAKTGYWPEELGARWTPVVEPDVLLFTTVGTDRTEVAPLGAADTLARLVRWSAWVMLEPDLAQAHLDLLRRLAAQTRNYRVTLGADLFTRPERLEEAVA